MLMGQMNPELRTAIEKLYTDRSDETSVACLLALHLRCPLLTYDHRMAHRASLMGIAGEHPARSSEWVRPY